VRQSILATRFAKTCFSLVSSQGKHVSIVSAANRLPLTEAGAAFSAAGFGNWFRDRCNEAGLPHCSVHGLRKACATRLANAGCTPEQIKAIAGHRTLSEVARHTKAADQERNAKQALANLLRSESEQACRTFGSGWKKLRKTKRNQMNFLEMARPKG
jgi:site-specific recombinase XerD